MRGDFRMVAAYFECMYAVLSQHVVFTEGSRRPAKAAGAYSSKCVCICSSKCVCICSGTGLDVRETHSSLSKFMPRRRATSPSGWSERLVKRVWSKATGQKSLVKSDWSKESGQKRLVKRFWSKESGQTRLVKRFWSKATGQK
jgi:hypothetical protein